MRTYPHGPPHCPSHFMLEGEEGEGEEEEGEEGSPGGEGEEAEGEDSEDELLSKLLRRQGGRADSSDEEGAHQPDR